GDRRLAPGSRASVPGAGPRHQDPEGRSAEAEDGDEKGADPPSQDCQGGPPELRNRSQVPGVSSATGASSGLAADGGGEWRAAAGLRGRGPGPGGQSAGHFPAQPCRDGQEGPDIPATVPLPSGTHCQGPAAGNRRRLKRGPPGLFWAVPGREEGEGRGGAAASGKTRSPPADCGPGRSGTPGQGSQETGKGKITGGRRWRRCQCQKLPAPTVVVTVRIPLGSCPGSPPVASVAAGAGCGSPHLPAPAATAGGPGQ